MKTFFLRFLPAWLLLALLLLPARAQERARMGDIPDVRTWIEARFGKGKQPPFSFYYNDVPSSKFITRWAYKAQKLSSDDPSIEKHRYTYRDPGTGLSIECDVTGFSEFHAVEWVMRLTNTGSKNTPILDRFLVVDQAFRQRLPATPSVLHLDGSEGGRYDFFIRNSQLSPGDTSLVMAPQGGRSSDETAFPFFNIVDGDEQEGLIVAIGWSGGWQAEVKALDRQNLSLQAGMQRFHLSLHPGETIRTPSICLLGWKGNSLMDGQNRFRRFQLAHHSRKIDGKFAEYPIAGGFHTGQGPRPCHEGECLDEAMLTTLMRRYKQFDVMPEAFWLDAGWYAGCGAPDYFWINGVGNWFPDSTRYPRGLKPVVDEAHRLGAKFLLWFEPERVVFDSWLGKNHPEWVLKSPGEVYGLLDLGKPEALDWLCNHIGNMVEEIGLDIYRQDFNQRPQPFWETHEAPDRIGMMEIRHIEGLYKFWDYLLERFPRLLIDNCASGGRRIDLETMSRSAPLWRSDYIYHEPTGKQGHSYALNYFLAQHGSGMYFPLDDYTLHCCLGTALLAHFDMAGVSQSVPDMKRVLETWKKYRPYFYEDYYPITSIAPNILQENIWLAYQMHRPSDGSGIVLAFRRKDSDMTRMRTHLLEIDRDKIYNVYNDITKQTIRMPGSQLIDGFYLEIPHAPGSSLLHYTIAE